MIYLKNRSYKALYFWMFKIQSHYFYNVLFKLFKILRLK